MGKVVVTNDVSLDGVMQAPGRPDEDVRGGFDRGGWALPYGDEVLGPRDGRGDGQDRRPSAGTPHVRGLCLLRPQQKDNPFTEVLDNVTTYVASTTLSEPLPSKNSTLLDGDATDAVADLKQQLDTDLAVLGSGELIQSLRRRKLIDEYVIIIHPLVLGSGRRLFPDGSAPADLRLVDSVTTTTGVMIATYRPA